MKDVSRRFGRGRAAVEGINLTVGDGEFLAVVGPSGSGKSTLLRLVAGLERPDTGEIQIAGRDARNLLPQDRDAALVFQNQAPFPHLDGFHNLAFGARARNVPSATIDERVESIASFLGLNDCLGRMPATMSGGEKQRLALGRALVRRPTLLLLDEPFSNLDTPLRVFLRRKLAEAHRQFGMTTILVSHDQAEASAMSDRLAVMSEGRIVQLGTGRDIYDRPANTFVAGFLGDPPIGIAEVAIADDEGGPSLDLVLAGQTIPIAGSGAWARHLRGLGRSRLLLGLRPEHVAPAGGEPAVTLRVLDIEERGSDRLCSLGREVGAFWMRSAIGGGPQTGVDARVRLDLDRASWFDPDTGERLALAKR